METMNLTDQQTAYSENVQSQIVVKAGSSPHENANVISEHTGYSPAEGPNINLPESASTMSAEQMNQLAQYYTYLADMYARSFRWMTQQQLGLSDVPQPTFMFPCRDLEYPFVVQQNAHEPADEEGDTSQPLDLSTKKGKEEDTPQPLDLSTKKGKVHELSTVLSATLEKDAVDQHLELTNHKDKVNEPSLVQTEPLEEDEVNQPLDLTIQRENANSEAIYSASKRCKKFPMKIKKAFYKKRKSFVDADNVENSNNYLPIKRKPKPSDTSSEPPAKRRRNNYTAPETALFEKIFSKCQYLKIVEVKHLAILMGKQYNQVKYWFRNRRNSKKSCGTTPPGMEFYKDTVIRPEFLACLDDGIKHPSDQKLMEKEQKTKSSKDHSLEPLIMHQHKSKLREEKESILNRKESTLSSSSVRRSHKLTSSKRYWRYRK